MEVDNVLTNKVIEFCIRALVPYDGSPNEEYWGIVDINREKKEVFEVVKARFNKAE